MAPIPMISPESADAAASVLHRLARRGEGGRIAGMFVGCLIGGIAAVVLVYFCFNCAFAPKPRGKTAQPTHPHVHKAHPHLHRVPSHARPVAQPHTHTHTHRHPHEHKWAHRHHRHTHHHRHNCKAKSKKQRPEAKQKTKLESSRHNQRPSQARGPTIRFMPMPPMTAMPIHPTPALGMGMGGGADTPPGDGFVDYGPAPDQDPGPGMSWDTDPNFRLDAFATERNAPGERETTCNECCYSFFDALCGVPKGARGLRREAAGDGEVVLEDNEMAAV